MSRRAEFELDGRCLGDPAQHGVEHRHHRRLLADGEAHRLVHGSVGRRAEKAELGRAQPQDVSRPQILGREAEMRLGQGIELTEPPQHGEDEKPRERPVAAVQLVEGGMADERLVGRSRPAAQSRVQGVEGHPPRPRPAFRDRTGGGSPRNVAAPAAAEARAVTGHQAAPTRARRSRISRRVSASP